MLHDFIYAHRSEILEVCLGELKTQHPDRSDRDLISDIPEFLDEVITQLVSDVTPANKAEALKRGTATVHGLKRKKQGFDIQRLIHDFGLVCQGITATAGKYDERPSAREFQIINRCIDNAIAEAVEAFTGQIRADEQFERAKELGMVAHELRNAVSNAMMGFQLIRRGRVPADGMTADVVERGLHRIASVVADSIVTVQTATVTHRAWINLHDIFLQLTEDLPTERGVRMAVEVDGNLGVEGDERLLVSAISNLLQNAIKFSRNDETITLRAADASDSIFIEIEDRCGGLPDGAAEEMFRPFVQKGADRRGLGLGLPIAQRAVQAHGGALRVRNLPGIGCVFSMRLPRTLGATAAG